MLAFLLDGIISRGVQFYKCLLISFICHSVKYFTTLYDVIRWCENKMVSGFISSPFPSFDTLETGSTLLCHWIFEYDYVVSKKHVFNIFCNLSSKWLTNIKNPLTLYRRVHAAFVHDSLTPISNSSQRFESFQRKALYKYLSLLLLSLTKKYFFRIFRNKRCRINQNYWIHIYISTTCIVIYATRSNQQTLYN